jgi:hypothetical protein
MFSHDVGAHSGTGDDGFAKGNKWIKRCSWLSERFFARLKRILRFAFDVSLSILVA